MKNDKVDKIGKWSEDKLEILQKYLEAYTQIMKSQMWCKGYYYIDAFAGSGKPMVEDEERFVDGSPRRALTIKHPFTKYIFIEKVDWRINKLNTLKNEFNQLDIEIEQGDCNDLIKQKVIPKMPFSSFKRAFIFLDPFGMNLEWSTLEQISKPKTLETLINFPIMAINRNVLFNSPSKITTQEREHMNKIWGNPNWETDLYPETPGLFGPQKEKVFLSPEGLADLYIKKRLKSIFPSVSNPLIVTNSKNAPLYALIFAGHSKTACKIVNDIVKNAK